MPAFNAQSPKVLPVILCGGSGTRLWPVSRQDYPKQFCDLLGTGATLLQATAKRIKNHSRFLPPLLVCNEQHRFLVAQQLAEAEIAYSGILLEPAARNTAPAILAAAHWANSQKATQDSLLWVMPADHHIPDSQGLLNAIAELANSDTQNKLFTFGIRPRQAETGYGYIKPSEAEKTQSAVAEFVEKPDEETAQRYVEQGYLWNSGMFAFSAQTIIEAGQRHCPDLVTQTRLATDNSQPDLDFIRLESESFSKAEDISIDYAIMEKADNIYVQTLSIDWNDIGSWTAIKEQYPNGDNGNVLVGNAHALDCNNCHIHSSNRTTAVIGCNNISVIETTDAVLVLDQGSAQNIKPLLTELKTKGDSSASQHRKVHRPWGSYQTIDEGERFKVKRLMVRPGAALSLQKHQQRSEHWVVVTGIADVTIGEQRRQLSANESVYIPCMEKHRLANPDEEWLEIIEVQSGDYLGEDDIIRYEDHYGRALPIKAKS